ncbi:mas-related G-protein coupled receptor member B8-like [Rattus norvegicus]|nr:mas-related G-protein coupled receptor member B8-like [Rattus norvegicus]NP_001396169.1 mas-related G-protein coupled receptor member B8-like [Rattus norvegicus]|eukprot:XP_003748910.1 PREDICTED: mas-related G-protein coupled receptor member B8-like [Rattus norvegicus]
MDSSIPDPEADLIQLNGSYHTETSPCVIESRVMILLSIIIAFFGLAGNAMVLWLLAFRMRRNVFSVYILNLAGANFLFLCTHTAFSLEKIIVLFHSVHIHIPLLFYTLSTLAYLAGVSMVTAISAEYWLSGIWPYWYQGQRLKHTTTVICTGLWGLALLLSLLEGKSCGFLGSTYNQDVCWKLDFIIVAWLLVLFAVLSRSIQVLLVRIFCGSQRTPVTKLHVTIVLTALVLVICGFPFGIIFYLLYWTTEVYYIMPCNSFHETILLLSYINSCANPIICLLVGSIRHCRFQCGTLRLLLHRAMQDIPEEEGEELEEVVGERVQSSIP